MGIRDRLLRRAGSAASALRDKVSGQPYAAKDLKRTPVPRTSSVGVRPLIKPEPSTASAAETVSDADTVDEEVIDPADLKPVSADDATRIEADVVTSLKTVFDPEIPVDIYELGLIYAIHVTDGPSVKVEMTLTSPNCPAAQSLPAEVKQKTRAVDGVVQAVVDIVWEPAWTPEMMSEEAQLELNL
jgi:FeS assembly SUF system protein